MTTMLPPGTIVDLSQRGGVLALAASVEAPAPDREACDPGAFVARASCDSAFLSARGEGEGARIGVGMPQRIVAEPRFNVLARRKAKAEQLRPTPSPTPFSSASTYSRRNRNV